jgi:hypothetical protein
MVPRLRDEEAARSVEGAPRHWINGGCHALTGPRVADTAVAETIITEAVIVCVVASVADLGATTAAAELLGQPACPTMEQILHNIFQFMFDVGELAV